MGWTPPPGGTDVPVQATAPRATHRRRSPAVRTVARPLTADEVVSAVREVLGPA
jgi:hypothetical protein